MAQARHDSITRRSLLSGAAAVVLAAAMPAATLPASPATLAAAPAAPDPIFVVIEAHVRAYDDVNAILDAVAAAEDALDAAKRGTRRAARKRLSAARAEEARLGGIETDATERLVATVPQTLQGAAAALRYIRERFEQGYPMCEEEEYMALLASIEQCLSRASAALPR
jgi:hypothetical protein